MKKLLSILGTITLISTGTTFLISCSNKMTDDNEPTDEPAAAKDAKILNEISKRASNSLQKYASKKSMIDETNYDISFEKLYKMVTLTNPSVVLAIDNPDVAKILQLIRTGFNAEFENINREIINDYPNYYPTAEQLAVVENSINYQLNYIDLTQLAKITGVDVTNVNAVRLDFRFNFVVRFKSLETTVPVTISYVLTGNAKIVNDLLSGVVAKVAKPIVNYFNQIKSIKIDSNQDFEKLYDNFDIIYTNNYEELDTIVMHKLNEPIKIDDDLAPFKDKITFVDSERMLNLVSAPITEAAAGNVAGSNAVFDLVANRTTAKWSG
ncbi:lipoprotein [Spiroplasma endosymbiont of Sarcophaga variegata]